MGGNGDETRFPDIRSDDGAEIDDWGKKETGGTLPVDLVFAKSSTEGALSVRLVLAKLDILPVRLVK